MTCAKFGQAAMFAFCLLSPVSASARDPGERIYSTAGSCVVASGLTAQQCQTAYANALAELDEKAPRFRSRGECEASFRRCMIAGVARGGVEFEPALRGFAVRRSAAGGGTVTPVVEGDNDLLGFGERTISRPDTSVSASSRAQAQKRWAEAQKARAALGSGADPQAGAPADEAAPTAHENPAAAAEYDRQSAARRAKEIREAPTLY